MPLIELHTWNVSESLLVFIITILVIWLILVLLSLRKFRLKKTIRYFVPMMIASLFLEAAAVASGRYTYPGYVVYVSVMGGSVPLIILLGWSTNLFLFLSMGSYLVKDRMKNHWFFRVILISIVTSAFGVCLDMLEDSIAHYNHWWIWTNPPTTVSFFGVPLSNFFDWFIILFFMSWAMQLIDQSRYSENRKLLISIISVSYVGAAIFFVHTAIITLFPFIGR